MRIRRLFPRNLADMRAELKVLGGSPEDIEAMLPRRGTVLLRLSDLTAEAMGTLRNVAEASGDICTLHLDVVKARAVLMIRHDHLWEYCARIESEAPNLADLTGEIKSCMSRLSDAGKPFRVGRRTYFRTGRPYVMGILNVTPDSFADGGKFLDQGRALEQAHRMVEEGADFIDIGGESSRPGAEPVSLVEEVQRVIPLITKLAKELKVPISIDTTKADAARRALDAGAQIVNDISALGWDEEMAETVADADATVVLMHMKGMPRTMQENPYYADLMDEVHSFLAERIALSLDADISRDRILIDPGIGFGKRIEDNLELLGRLREFTDLGPVLVGPSRKNFIGKVLDLPVEERLPGTAAAVAVAAINGADVVRVHDVKPMREIAEIASRCMTGTARETTN